MSNGNYGRYSPNGLEHRKDAPPPRWRPKSSQLGNNILKERYTFLQYKNENRKKEDQPKLKPISASNRNERRKSKMNIDYSAENIDEYAATQNPRHNSQNIENQDNLLPLKIFDGTKKAITDVSEHSRSYFWMRRIKEIFLQMGTTEDPFVDFDMSLARADLIAACDVYIQNNFSKLKKSGSTPEDAEERGLIQKIEESIKQLRNYDSVLADKNTNNGAIANLRVSAEQLILNIKALKQKADDIVLHLQNPIQSKDTTDAIRKTIKALPKESKSQLKIRQEWDMKKLYSEVFKSSYIRNELRTLAQKAELKPDKKGNEEPNFRNAIWWYSCNEASIYYQINSILRLENFELLMAYRYYISDLCKMIEYIHDNEQSYGNKIFYRAASIPYDQLEQMKKSLKENKKGQVISMGGFTSTTTNLDIAKYYARTQSITAGNVRVLFKITAAPDKPCAAYAYIGNLSFHPEEEETLFSMGSTFSVEKIDEPGSSDIEQSKQTKASANSKKEETNYCTIHTTASDVDKALLDDIRAKVQECSAAQLSVLLARYMLELGQYRAARKYLTELCRESNGILKDDPALPSIFNCLGMTFSRQNLYADAIEYYKKALDFQTRIEYSNNNALADIHNNIGLSYIGLKHMEEAQATFEEAERIQLREPVATRSHIASIYANIAYVHYAKKGAEQDLENSKNYFEKAVRIYQKSTSKITHDAIERALLKAECYSNYGHLLSAKKDADAQERYNEALKIYKSILPEGDPKLMRAHMNIIMEHAHNENYEKVIELYEDPILSNLIDKQAGNLFVLDKVITLDDLVLFIQVVGACYTHYNEQYFKAMRAWTRAYELERKAKLVQLLFTSESSTLQWSRKLVDIAYNKAYAFFTSDNPQMPKNDEEQQEQNQTASAKNNSSNNSDQIWPSINFSRGYMCFKRYLYEDGIRHLEKAIQETDNFYASLLLAEMLQATGDTARAQKAYTDSLKKTQAMKNHVLLVEISITRIKCLKDDSEAIESLKHLEATLSANDNDTTRISLKAIVYDTIIEYYLKTDKYRFAIEYASKKSIPLKMRSLSHYHPSLAANYLLLAQAYIARREYTKAIKYFENAVEIQCLNLASNHLEIKLIYYQMGDTYCEMNQLDQAREKYDFAENDIIEDDYEQDVDTKTTYNQRRLIVRVSMNQHLAETYARRTKSPTAEATASLADLTTAIEKYSTSIELLKELYPFEIVIQSLNIMTFVERLKRIALYHEYLADAMVCGQSDDTQTTYENVLTIQAKLLRYMDVHQGEVIYKIGLYYEQRQEDLETAISYYQNAIKESLKPETAIKTHYALGRLMEEWNENPTEAEKYYNEAYKLIDDDDVSLKTILHKKCPALQQSNHFEGNDTTMQESNENENNEVTSEIVQKAVSTFEQSDDDAISKNAEAYQKLDDSQSLITYCKNFIDEHADSDIQNENEISNDDEATSDQQLYLKILTDIVCACAEDISFYNIGGDEKLIVRKLSEAYLYWGHVLRKSREYNEAVQKYFQSFSLYQQCAEATAQNTQLIEFVEKLKKNEFSNVDTLVSQFMLISPDEGTRLWLQIAATYRDESYQTDESINPIDNAIHACSNALEKVAEREPILKVTCHYAILRIYKDLRYANDEGRRFIEQMAKDGDYKKRQKHLTMFDQRLISRWVLDFIDEYNEQNEDDQISTTLGDEFFLPSLEDAMNENNDSFKCIGNILMSVKDYQGAIAYWQWIINECESCYSNLIKYMFYDEEKSIGEIFNQIQQLEGNAHEYLQRLVTSYVQLTNYYISASERPDISARSAVDHLKAATSQCELAIETRAQLRDQWKPEKNELTKLLKDIEKKWKDAETKADEDDEDDSDNNDEDEENDDDDYDLDEEEEEDIK